MDEAKNPFSPGAGTQPPELAGRQDILQEINISLVRLKNGLSAKSLFMIGLRGVGKTVLLRAIQRSIEGQNYATTMLEVDEHQNFIPLLIRSLRQVLLKWDQEGIIGSPVKKALRVLKSFLKSVTVSIGDFGLQLDFEPEPGIADSGMLDADLLEVFIAMAEAAKEEGTAFALIIDELQYLSEKELRALIMSAHKLMQLSLPFLIVGAGLPQLASSAGKAKSYAERLFDYPELGKLKKEEAKAALQIPVNKQGVIFTDEALDEIVRITEGYPYFLQMWGYAAWNFAKAGNEIDINVIHQITPKTIEQLDQNFFRVRYERLKQNEKRYLRAMAELGGESQRSGSIAKQLGLSVNQVAPIRDSLINKGMIYSKKHGDNAFSVPLFGDFMKRVMPEFPLPE